VDPAEREAPRNLASAQKELARARIQAAAQEVVAQRGFAATVEEIAQISGVSPRTVYRHYQTHDRLIASTVKAMYFDDWIKDLNFSADNFEGWFKEFLVRVHRRSADVIGAAFWDIHGPRTESSEILSEVDALRRDFRLRGMRHIASLVWHMAGGAGDPPDDLVLAFALNMSAFATRALIADFDQTPEQIGELTSDILKELVSNALGTQQSQHANPPAQHQGITAAANQT
jgi:AcrR family transcriptional regulator